MAPFLCRLHARGGFVRLLLGLVLFALASAANAGPGDPLGSELTLNAAGAANRQYPAVASNARGDTVAVWIVDLGGDAAEILGRRLAADGTARGEEFRIAAVTRFGASGLFPLFRNRPAVAIDAEGRFVVAWTDSPQPNVVRAQRFAADGRPDGAPVEVASSFGDILATTVAMNAHGDFLVGWSEYPRSVGLCGSVCASLDRGSFRARRYRAGGSVSRVFIVDPNLQLRINTFESSYGLGSMTAGFSLAVGLADDGGFAVAWSRYGLALSSLYTRRYDARGLPGPTLPVTLPPAGPSVDSSLAMTPDGSRYALAYYAAPTSQAPGVYAQSIVGLLPEGEAQAACTRCVSYGLIPDRPAVTIAADGSHAVSAVAIAYDAQTRAEIDTVVVQRYARGGGALGDAITVASPAVSPALASDGAGHFIVVWAAITGSDQAEIRARRYAGP